MKWTLIAAVVLLIASGCEKGNGYNAFLRPCNRVDIVLFNGGDSLFFNTTDSTGVQILVAQIKGNPNSLKDTCPADGYLRYRKDSTLLLQASFAARQPGCRSIRYFYDGYNFAHGINDRAGKLLESIMQQAGKK